MKKALILQYYAILSGTLELHIENSIIKLHPGDKYTIPPKCVHWATSDDECWLEIYSKPGWTKEDHIPVSLF